MVNVDLYGAVVTKVSNTPENHAGLGKGSEERTGE